MHVRVHHAHTWWGTSRWRRHSRRLREGHNHQTWLVAFGLSSGEEKLNEDSQMIVHDTSLKACSTYKCLGVEGEKTGG